MAKLDLEKQKEDILKKLQEAGDKGLNKTGLNITSKAPGSRMEAFKALEKEKKVANIGSAKKVQYVLQEFYRPLEMAYEKIETYLLANQKPDKMKLVSRSKLADEVPAGIIRGNVDKAIDLLLKENKLLKLKHGNGTYLLHANPVLELLSFVQISPEKIAEKPMAELTTEHVLEAYMRVKQRSGFSNVEIYELQQELGAPMEQLKEFLLQESKQGRVILGLGDWSLSSEETKSGAVYMRGKPHLLVRFKE